MFFTDWFTGAVENTDANFGRVADVLAPDFVLVSPRGRVFDRDGILAQIREAHAGRDAGAFRIWTDEFALRFSEGPLSIATYREWQDTGREQTCRMSTVVLRKHPTTPNRVEWVHLHETWLPAAPGQS
jgi:hypothetical protein